MRKSIRLWVVFLFVVISAAALTCAHAAVGDTNKPETWNGQQTWIRDEEIASLIGNDGDANALAALAFRLPASLQTIEDEAFEGTALVRVELPDTLVSIGDKAFANIPTLRSIRIPENTKWIARSAFAGSDCVTITGAPNSYARAWARENGIPFAPVAVMYAGTGSVQLTISQDERKEQADAAVLASDDRALRHPQYKPFSEIQSERYDACVAHHISGRAPPRSLA